MKKIEDLKISPSPWRISDSGKTNGCIVDAEGIICASGAPSGCPPANARLIAASPKLYKKAYDIVENLRIHLAVPSQSIEMNRSEVEAMARELEEVLSEASGETSGEGNVEAE